MVRLGPISGDLPEVVSITKPVATTCFEKEGIYEVHWPFPW